jgi:PAS domain S-box-containing protein
MKFSKRFLFVPIFLAAFSYLFYSAYQDVRDRTLNEFNTQLFTLAKQASRGIESFFIYYQRELLFLTKLKYVSDLNDQGKDLLEDFYKSHADQIEAITIVDTNGILEYTFPYNKAAIGQNISNQEHVKAIIKSHKPTVSDVFTSVQGYKAIAYHIPIISGNRYKGSIAILISLDKLSKRFIENIKTGETGYGCLISEVGIELFDPLTSNTGESIKERYNSFPSVLELIDRTSNESEGTALCYISPTSKTLTVFHRVPLGNTFWTILIFTPENEIFAKLDSFRNRLYILFILISIVMIIYFYLSFKASTILKEEKNRKALEKILRESEKRFRTMFELSPAGIILIDEKGTIIEVNTSFCDTLEYSKKEITGQNIRFFASPEKEGVIEKNIADILSGITIKHEVTNFKKDGTTCIIALYETMILLPDGTPGILSVSNDITEKKHSQERMLTLSRALESIGECVSITDHNNKIIFVNNAFCKTYGYNQEEIIGKNISILRSFKKEGIRVDELLSKTIHGGWNGELINIRKDGSEFPIELSTSPIKDEKGNPIALIGIAVDITERKKIHQELISAKEKAEESDKLKSAFLANMSHELRTPLNAVIGFSGLMIESGSDNETISNSKIILNSGMHLLGLVEDILDISMIETGQLRIKYEKAGIYSILNEVKNIILGEKLKENKTGIEIILKIDPEFSDPHIFTDSRRLKQVLINLLKNSLKFTDEGQIEFGFVEIERIDKKYLRFYVKDTGIGIDQKNHNSIFEIFRQVDDTPTRIYGGTGIGLSIAKKTIELLGGEIWVDSEIGKGSVFYFTIPAFQEKIDTKNIQLTTVSVTGKKFSGKTVLIAEDDLASYEFLNIFLKTMKIRVLWAKNGIEAINICETDSSIDLVLMDIKMPYLNGYEATRTIKKMRPDLPVIAQTAYAMLSEKEEAFNSGCDEYLSKPIKITRLIEVLNQYLNSYKPAVKLNIPDGTS